MCRSTGCLLLFFHDKQSCILAVCVCVLVVIVCASLWPFQIDANRVAIANDASLTAAGPKLWSRFPNTRDEHTSEQTHTHIHTHNNSATCSQIDDNEVR